MPIDLMLYIIYSNTSIIISIAIAQLFWQRRNASGAKTMALLMLLAAFWAFSDFFSDLSEHLSIKMMWDNLAYFAVVAIPVAWLVFSLQYTKQEKYLTRRNLALLSLLPVITLLMIWTNDFHHLFKVRIGTARAGLMTIIEPTYGVWFWIHTAYSYFLIFFGTVLLIKKLVNLPEIYRNQSIMMILATLAPFIGNVLYTFGINPFGPVDPTVFSFTFTGIFCFLGMFRYKLFELVPAAREAVIESMSEIVIVLDKQDRIIDLNSSARSLIGKNETDFIGKSIFEFSESWSSVYHKYVNVMKAAEKITIINKENNKRHFGLRITPLYDSKNKLSGRFIVLHDITAFEEAIENLKESREAAEEANKAKSRFLATVSHELRTPLNGIIGMAELVSSANLTEEEKGYLQSLKDSSQSLLDIINEVLDFSKIEAGKMELEKINFNLKNLVDATIKTFLPQANEKDIKLTKKIDGDIPENTVGDPVRLKQVLVNLIGNALKFTEKGRIEVRVEKLKCEDRQVLLQFSVTDTGIGIPANKIENLFKSFQQLDSSTTRKYGGTGLGLAIVKDLIAMMGGCIEVESKWGEGSRFFFTIPLQVEDSLLSDGTTVPGSDFMNKDITILLAEDNKVNQMFMVKLLEKKNFEVDVAENGQIALEKLGQKFYDLILMDIQMPEMDGYEATLAIRKNEEHTGMHIPIIALTANATEEDKNRCFQAGMDDFITKPVKSEKLYACLKKYIV